METRNRFPSGHQRNIMQYGRDMVTICSEYFVFSSPIWKARAHTHTHVGLILSHISYGCKTWSLSFREQQRM